MKQNVGAILTELRERLERLYGERLVCMMLYGSQARGDAEPGSDIDVLVVLRGEVAACEEIARTAEDAAQVSLKHDAVVVCAFVSEDQFRHEESPLLLNVRREGVRV